jgi:hypothetical protein
VRALTFFRTVVQEDLPEAVLKTIAAEVQALVDANVPLARFSMGVDAAQAAYNGAFLETPRRLDAGVTSVDLVYIEGVLLCSASAALLPAAGFLTRVDVQRVGYCVPARV